MFVICCIGFCVGARCAPGSGRVPPFRAQDRLPGIEAETDIHQEVKVTNDIYTYVDIFVIIYMIVYIYIYKYIHIRVSLSLYIYIYIYIHMRERTYRIQPSKVYIDHIYIHIYI